MENAIKTSRTLKGLNGWQLKCVAMLFMTVDHIGAYNIVTRWPYYSVLRILGRIAAPIFLYLCIEGIRYTRSRWFYLKKLYLMGVLSSLLACVLFTMFPSFYYKDSGMTDLGGSLDDLQSSNLFFCFFVVVLMITSAEGLRKAIQARDKKQAGKELLCFLLPILLIPVKVIAANGMDDLVAAITGSYHDQWYGWTVGSFFPTLLDSAYTCLFLILGYIWYLVKDKRYQMGALFAFSLVGILNAGLAQGTALDWGILYDLFGGMFTYPQFFMLLAIPFLACYNGERGRKNQSFCYVYYPLHIVVLTTISLLLGRGIS